jgi:ribosomal-protein-alanine N-acetyltransferase
MAKVQPKVEEVFAVQPTLESDRLLIRAISPADTADMFAYTSDVELLQHLPLDVTPTLAEAENAVRGFVGLYELHRAAPWGITVKETGRHIGIVGFESWNPVTDRAEIGFLIARSHWRQGYASEAALRVMRFGFERMGLNRIEARVKPENEASRLLLEAKLGMRREALMREQSWWRGSYHDLELYAILKREFYAHSL